MNRAFVLELEERGGTPEDAALSDDSHVLARDPASYGNHIRDATLDVDRATPVPVLVECAKTVAMNHGTLHC